MSYLQRVAAAAARVDVPYRPPAGARFGSAWPGQPGEGEPLRRDSGLAASGFDREVGAERSQDAPARAISPPPETFEPTASSRAASRTVTPETTSAAEFTAGDASAIDASAKRAGASRQGPPVRPAPDVLSEERSSPESAAARRSKALTATQGAGPGAASDPIPAAPARAAGASGTRDASDTGDAAAASGASDELARSAFPSMLRGDAAAPPAQAPTGIRPAFPGQAAPTIVRVPRALLGPMPSAQRQRPPEAGDDGATGDAREDRDARDAAGSRTNVMAAEAQRTARPGPAPATARSSAEQARGEGASPARTSVTIGSIDVSFPAVPAPPVAPRAPAARPAAGADPNFLERFALRL